MADLFIQLRFSNSCHGLGLGLIPRRTLRKRAAATGNVQRGLFYLEKGDVLGASFFFFFFSPRCCCCNHTFYVFQLKKKKNRRRKQSGVKGLARLTKARRGFFFFFSFFSGTLDFLRNYINSGVFKSVFHRQKGGKL